MNEVVENWKDIDGFSYQVSNFGRIKSLGRYIPYVDSRTGKECQRWAAERVLKTSVGTSGYETVHIYTDEPKRHTIMVHRLVAEYFIPCVEGKDFVNHKDGDKLFNQVSNLEWVTRSENILHALDAGLLHRRGEDSNFAKLSEREVKEIISLRKFNPKKFTCNHIAKKYDISEKYVSYLSSRKSYRWATVIQSTSEEELKEIFEQVNSEWNPESLTRQGRKYKLTDEESDQIIARRLTGDKVRDIAEDFDKPQRFISWYTLKHLKE